MGRGLKEVDRLMQALAQLFRRRVQGSSRPTVHINVRRKSREVFRDEQPNQIVGHVCGNDHIDGE